MISLQKSNFYTIEWTVWFDTPLSFWYHISNDSATQIQMEKVDEPIPTKYIRNFSGSRERPIHRDTNMTILLTEEDKKELAKMFAEMRTTVEPLDESSIYPELRKKTAKKTARK